jgi:UDP-glucose 4-epimerase
MSPIVRDTHSLRHLVQDKDYLFNLAGEVNGSGRYEIREFPADRRVIDIGDYYADFSKIRRELDSKPKRSLRETIGTTLGYFRQTLPNYL